MKVFKKSLAAAAAALIGIANICSTDTKPLIGNIDTVSAETYSDEMQNGDLNYKKVDKDDDGTYDYIEISSCDFSAVTVEIPAEIDSLPVTSIGKHAFYECSKLTSIKIPNSATSIGDGAFINCHGLTSIEIPNSVITIGDTAFSNCSKLTNIEIPNSVTSIGDGAFWICNVLKSITIENPKCEIYDSVKTISNGDIDNYYKGVILGHENSTAQAYAEKYGYKFENLDSNPQVPTDPTEPSERVSGDVDGDGDADLYDAIIVCKCMIGAKDVTEEQKKNADVNGDGHIDLYDAIYVAECMIGKHK